ncbi:BMP family ABC transporter substrate-binding protein [Salidesulfovibrio onnuriiensis]|uniref:BMP family ABC transporter substrate-binding protein n=1 Tax=Salidesulfovibrio onnuriiensis TaxID=2583823 RepID=UPI0011CC5BC9|nr:BMP family ABC transporter substrate-binding protein [Salidesulfovibrio onnuriiensis]
MKQFTRFFIAAIASAAMLMSLFACGEAPQKAEEKAEKPAAEKKEEAKKFKAGFVYVSPVGDAGYSFAHDLGRQAVADLDWVETSFVESVAEGADSERVIRNMARKDFDVIFTTSFGYMDPTLKVASEFPNVKFMHCSGFKKAPNMNNYFGRMYQARFLTGLVAGSMTKSNIIGYVAAFPIPEVIRGINAFTLGVREVNPKAEVRVVWTKTWYDPALEKDAAISLLDVGADIIAQHQDSPGPQEAAQDRGAYSIGYNSNMASFAPKAHLTAAIWNWAPLYVETVKEVRDGTWKGDQALWWGMDKGIVDLAPYGDMVPEDVRKLVEAKKAEIVSGKDMVFAGPIKNQKGEVAIPEGQSASDEQMLGMTWFVEGVVGTTE